ncbi:MAG: hypothetical protein N3F67_00880 [Acidilobaceae archaeon]|nr:hypothetical protein [Acidilobaceae archaeon]
MRELDALRKLLEKREEYFDKRGALNSEGIKLLKIIARGAIRENPLRRKAFREALRERSYESVRKLAERLEELKGGLSPS